MNIGYWFNCSMNTNPIVRLSPTVINRAMLIDQALKRFGSRIFFYSPKHIKAMDAEIPGYFIEDNEFIPSQAPIPRVNGNWTYSTRKLLDQGLGYYEFSTWAARNGVNVYVPMAFSDLAVQKQQAYEVIRGYKDELHPYTELYRRSTKQLAFFLDRSPLVIIKPRAGNKGDGVVSVRRKKAGYRAVLYRQGKTKKLEARQLESVADFIAQETRKNQRLIIQEGVETIRHEGSVFDMRVIMLFDGIHWDWLHEVRYSRVGSDISNVSQGGRSLVTEDFLRDLLGAEAGDRLLAELRDQSFGLAMYLDSLHPGELMEIAFDFVVATDGTLRLVEMNTKPGLVSVGFLNPFYSMQPGQQGMFERWVYPHTDSLARFLQAKALEFA